MEVPTYRGQEVLEVKNKCGGGYNHLDKETVRYVQLYIHQRFSQIFVMKDGTEIEGTVDDILFVDKK